MVEEEIRRMEEDMQSHYSEAASVQSKVQELMDQVEAEEEEKMSMSQSHRQSANTMREGQNEEEEEESEESDEEGHNVFYKASELIYQPKSVERQWLRKHGKSKYIDFDEDQMAILNDCFKDLDEDGSNAIGVDELEDPLIALGLVDTREQVEEMVAAIDDDYNIEFNEFLKLVKGGKKTKAKMQQFMNEESREDQDIIFNFFQKLTNGEMKSNENIKVGFGVYYSQERRRKILEAILGGQNAQTSSKILENYSKQLQSSMGRVKQQRQEMQETGVRPDPSEMDQIKFQQMRADAFDRNELDPDILRRLIADLKTSSTSK